MQRWEYCQVWGLDITYFDEEALRTIRAEQSYPGELIIDASARLVARLGLEGWEAYDVHKGEIYRMKRPIPDSQP